MSQELQVLPTSAGRLPINYEAACAALQRCDNIDECKDWADRAAAIAAYAAMARDERLTAAAMRVRLRAIRRLGELIGPSRPGRGGGDTGPAAELSIETRKNARRVANVPQRLFESLTESSMPPGVAKMAALGTRQPDRALEQLKRDADRKKASRADNEARFRAEHRLLDFLIDRQRLRLLTVREAREWAQKQLERARAILLLTAQMDDELIVGDLCDEAAADQALAEAMRRERNGR